MNFYSKTHVLSFGVIIFMVFTTIAFQDSGHIKSKRLSTNMDTVPKINDSHADMKELDKSMNELEIEMKNLGNQLKDIDFDKISREVQESIGKIDFDKMRAEIDHSLKGLDMEKLKAELQKSLKEVDNAKINAEIKKAIKDATASMNSDQIRKSLEEVKKMDFEKLKGEMKTLIEELEKNKVNIKESIEKAMEELKNTEKEKSK